MIENLAYLLLIIMNIRDFPGTVSFDRAQFFTLSVVHDPFIRCPSKSRKDLTYIVVGNCIDGTALIADTRMTIDAGAAYSYGRKIFNPYSSIIMAASGTTGHFRSFRARFNDALVANRELPGNEKMDATDFRERLLVITEQVIQKMALDYRQQHVQLDLEVLMISRFPNNSIYHFSIFGSPEPVTTYRAIGHGEPYGAVILKTLWKKTKPMTMEKFAKISCLILRYITELDLDNSVGYSEEYSPIINYIPKFSESINENNMEKLLQDHPINELDNFAVNSMLSNIDDRFLKLKDSINGINL